MKMKSMRNFLACLAAVMLVSMLASCNPQSQGGDTGKTETTTEVETEDNYVFPADLEIPEQIEDFDVADYGIGAPFDDTDFNFILNEKIGSACFDEMEEKFGEYKSYSDVKGMDKKAEYVRYRNSLVLSGLDYEKSRRNVALVLDIDDEDTNGWVHTLVSTSDDFALVSRDSEGNAYLTGLVDGEIRSDAGFMSEETFKNTYKLIDQNGYDEALNIIRKEFFGYLAGKANSCSAVRKLSYSSLSNFGYYDVSGDYEVGHYSYSLRLNGDYLSTVHLVYDVPENCIGEIASGFMNFDDIIKDEVDDYQDEQE